MGEFVTELTNRFHDAHASLSAARDAGDHDLAETRLAEIEDLHRLADRHDITLPGSL